MKWKLRLFGGGPEEPSDAVDLNKHRAAAEDALAKSHRALNDTRQRQPEVTRLTRSLREIRQRNHFADLIRESFKGAT